MDNPHSALHSIGGGVEREIPERAFTSTHSAANENTAIHHEQVSEEDPRSNAARPPALSIDIAIRCLNIDHKDAQHAPGCQLIMQSEGVETLRREIDYWQTAGRIMPRTQRYSRPNPYEWAVEDIDKLLSTRGEDTAIDYMLDCEMNTFVGDDPIPEGDDEIYRSELLAEGKPVQEDEDLALVDDYGDDLDAMSEARREERVRARQQDDVLESEVDQARGVDLEDARERERYSLPESSGDETD